MNDRKGIYVGPWAPAILNLVQSPLDEDQGYPVPRPSRVELRR